MKPISFEYKKTSCVPVKEFNQLSKALVPEIKRIKSATKTGYETDYASINLCSDKKLIPSLKKIIKQKHALDITAIVVVGIGGSNLGTMAIQQALLGSVYNLTDPEVKIYFADTVDSDSLSDILALIDREYENGGSVIINVVSKSGTTTESIANFEILVSVAKIYEKTSFKNKIVVTTDKDSKLWNLAHKEKFTCLEIPAKVGGRYSVFSVVGLFPLGFIGIDIQELLDGACSALDSALNVDVEQNPAALNALALAYAYSTGKNIHDTFLFSPELENLGKWYRQLMAESIGKEFDRQRKRVNVGITPTVSIGSTDLHSMAQLYLGGPHDKFTSFVRVSEVVTQLEVPKYKQYDSLVPKIQGKPLQEIMDAIIDGTQKAYYAGSRPYVTWTLPSKNEYYLGQFMQFKMLEIMYLGFLLDVNPFDQPNVEVYKQETRKILAHE